MPDGERWVGHGALKRRRYCELSRTGRPTPAVADARIIGSGSETRASEAGARPLLPGRRRGILEGVEASVAPRSVTM